MRPIILAALMTVTLAACSSQPPEEAALEAAAKALGAIAVNSMNDLLAITGKGQTRRASAN